MFESLSLLQLQQYWWIIISLLGSILVFLLFVQGGQTMINTLSKSKGEKRIIINAIGRKWEFTFTTLVTFGGAFFASFPLFYSTSFGGACYVWFLILFTFIVQAVSYEFRIKPNNFIGEKTYERFLLINGLISPILLGIAVGTFFTGSKFVVSDYNLSAWKSSFHGLEAAINPLNLLLGFAALYLSRVLALLYFIKNIDNVNIIAKCKEKILPNAIPFLIFFVTFILWLMFISGYALNPDTKIIYLQKFKYLHNIIEMPLNTAIFLIGVVLVLFGILRTRYSFEKSKGNGIWFAGTGTVLTIFSLFILAGFNNTAYYPSSFDIQSSLTIQNSSSSKYTLTAMSYVSLLVPFVFAYIIYAWRAINNKKIDIKELNEGLHY